MLDENYQVSKSKELLILSDLHLAIGELKIFDTYLSKIDTESLGKIEKSYEEKLTQANTRQEVEKVSKEMKHELDKCGTVIFTKSDYCRLLGIESKVLRNEKMLSYIKNLQSVFYLFKTDTGYKKVNLFHSSSYNVNNQEITLTCNVYDDEVKKLFFDKENFLYNKYRLKNTLHLKSIYSFHMYNYLLDNIYHKKGWEVSVDELRKKLDCQKDTYMDFRYFNNKVLKKIQTEINKKTNLCFQYTAIKNCKKKVEKIHIDCQFQDTEGVITTEYEETKILTKDKAFQLYSGCLGSFMAELNRPLSDKEIENIGVWCQKYDERRVICALNEAVVYGKKDFDYIGAILKSWKEKGLSVEDIEKGKR